MAATSPSNPRRRVKRFLPLNFNGSAETFLVTERSRRRSNSLPTDSIHFMHLRVFRSFLRVVCVKFFSIKPIKHVEGVTFLFYTSLYIWNPNPIRENAVAD
jgi:hypothetical protein